MLLFGIVLDAHSAPGTRESSYHAGQVSPAHI